MVAHLFVVEAVEAFHPMEGHLVEVACLLLAEEVAHSPHLAEVASHPMADLGWVGPSLRELQRAVDLLVVQSLVGLKTGPPKVDLP